MNLSSVTFGLEIIIIRILVRDFNLNSKIVVGSYPDGEHNREEILLERLRKKYPSSKNYGVLMAQLGVRPLNFWMKTLQHFLKKRISNGDKG